MKVKIGFDSGSEITLDVVDANKFVQDIGDCIRNAPHASMNWYVEPNCLLIAIHRITYILPAHPGYATPDAVKGKA